MDSPFPNMSRWWTEDPKKIMAFLYWMKGQIPPIDPVKYDEAWENISKKLNEIHPRNGSK